jgi:hypothetical protein
MAQFVRRTALNGLREQVRSYRNCVSLGNGSAADISATRTGLFAGKPDSHSLMSITNNAPGTHPVGAGLPAKAMDQPLKMLNVLAPSQASLTPTV